MEWSNSSIFKCQSQYGDNQYTNLEYQQLYLTCILFNQRQKYSQIVIRRVYWQWVSTNVVPVARINTSANPVASTVLLKRICTKCLTILCDTCEHIYTCIYANINNIKLDNKTQHHIQDTGTSLDICIFIEKYRNNNLLVCSIWNIYIFNIFVWKYQLCFPLYWKQPWVVSTVYCPSGWWKIRVCMHYDVCIHPFPYSEHWTATMIYWNTIIP